MTTTAPKDIPGALRRLHTIQLAFLVSVGLYIYVGEIVRLVVPPKNFVPMAAIAAGATVAGLWVVHRRMLEPARQRLREDPGNAFALKRWRDSYLILFSFCEALVLYGFMVRMLGGSLAQAVPFYACAVLAFVIFTPRRP